MKIANGDKISVEYTGMFENGEVFDSSIHGDHSHPLEFVVGDGEVIGGFDKAVIGMEKGEEKEFTIEAKDAYGEYNPNLVQKIPREALPADQEPKVGMTLMVKSPDGREFPLRISKIEDDGISLDVNHPLAGKRLIFKIKILDIVE